MSDKLNIYISKRNFDKTDEPSVKSNKTDEKNKAKKTRNNAGKDSRIDEIKDLNAAEKGAELKFVVQRHWARREHYDFRLEWQGVLLSWAVPKGPSFNTADKRLAVHVENHPFEYKDFEGVIPKGEYGGGVVMIWDEGTYLPFGNIGHGLENGSIKFEVFGKRLKGKWALVRMDGTREDGADNWLLIKEKDRFVKDNSGIDSFITSVRTNRNRNEIESGAERKTVAKKTAPQKTIDEAKEYLIQQKTGRKNSAALSIDGKAKRMKRGVVKNPFEVTQVQLAKLAESVPKGNEWAFELKYDGYRIVAYVEGGGVRLLTRNGNDYGEKFFDIADSLVDWADGRAFVLDGEVVVTDDRGKTDFQALQNFLKKPDGKKLCYIMFDILALDGVDLRERTLLERKALLEQLMNTAPPNLHYSAHTVGNGEESFKTVCEGGFEGLIGKRTDSVYSGTRNGDWIKLKCESRQEFVVGGFTRTGNKQKGISALLLGYYEDGKLVYCGRVGTGFSESESILIEKKLMEIAANKAPFMSVTKGRRSEEIVWVKPVFAAEVKFTEWTNENSLRHPSFKGLREDKDIFMIVREKAVGEQREKTVSDDIVNIEINSKASDNKNMRKKKDLKMMTKTDTKMQNKNETEQSVKEKKAQDGKQKNIASSIRKNKQSDKEQSNKSTAKLSFKQDETVIEGVKLTNPQKQVFANPPLTKGELAEYYAAVSKYMLPYLEGRILSLICCPQGVKGSCFYKKHSPTDGQGLVKQLVANSEGGEDEYFYITDATGLIYLVQMNTIEFHTWGSRTESIMKPDIMVFDLDPDEGMAIDRVCQGVKDLKTVLDELSLVSFLKTSGGKGYHVVVPLTPSADWEGFRAFAKSIAQIMESKWPDRYTSNVRKVNRKGKIFIDWIRNTKSATSIAPYSVRARNGAKVSAPIAWNELDKIAPDGIETKQMIKRLKNKDPWADFFKTAKNQRLD